MVGAGWQLRGYRALSRAFPTIAGPVLKRRLARGKEDAVRWQEKLGKATEQRPGGRLVWMHAVGLGEVLALRGLIAAMQDEDDGLRFLVTSTTKTSAEVFGRAAPPDVLHQFLPLDAPRFVSRFLQHWRPDLSVWAEQDIWPNAVCMAAEQGIPLALVNARMGDAARNRRARFSGLYRDVLARFSLIAAQDERTAHNLAWFGADAVSIAGSLKAAAAALPVDVDVLTDLRARLAGRSVWLLASSHGADEAVAMDAMRYQEGALLIIAPRDVARAESIRQTAQRAGLRACLRSEGGDPREVDVYIADTYGEMGLWYRLAMKALIGGTFDETEGHSPWEAAALNTAILHGPRIGNFETDFALLHHADAAREVSPQTLNDVLKQDLSEMTARAAAMVGQARAEIRPLAARLTAMVNGA